MTSNFKQEVTFFHRNMWWCFFKDLFKELQEAVQQDGANTHEIDDEVVNTLKEENHHKKRVKERQHKTTFLRPSTKH